MRVICFLLLSCLALPAQALALLDAYALALRNDPSFQAAIAERDAGLEERAVGRAGLLPRLAAKVVRYQSIKSITPYS